MSDEQFAKIVELLTPGYELSTMMLAEYRERQSYMEKQRQPADAAAAGQQGGQEQG
jgi:hypothetical protein